MAGKEFKAKARTVQKMSRDGLVEENLRTGKTRKVRAAADTGQRIGDRPMDALLFRHRMMASISALIAGAMPAACPGKSR